MTFEMKRLIKNCIRYLLANLEQFGVSINMMPSGIFKFYGSVNYRNSKYKELSLEKLNSKSKGLLEMEETYTDYLHRRNKILSKCNMEKLDIQFLGIEHFCGSLGVHYHAKILIDAMKLELCKRQKLICIIGSREYRNKAMADYFKDDVIIVRDKESAYSLRNLESLLTLPMGYIIPLGEKAIQMDLAYNLVLQKKSQYPGGNVNYKITKKQEDIGQKFLKSIGIKRNQWFVALHVREPSYRGEDKYNTNDGFRNSNIANYLEACKWIISLGGVVFRIGDKNMTPMPKISGIVDYAHCSQKSEVLDIFLLSQCKFCIGTPSGPFRIAQIFGRPVILTNCGFHSPYFSLGSLDSYLPRLTKINNRYISLKEMFSDKYIAHLQYYYTEENIETTENTSDEILAAVKQHYYIIFENKNENNLMAEAISIINGNNIGGDKYRVECLASISEYFLAKHKEKLFLNEIT